MNDEDAKQIGAILALKSVGIGILIAQSIFIFLTFEGSFLKNFFWFVDVDYKLNLIIGLLAFTICGNFYGRIAGYEILIKKEDYTWIGIKYAFLTLLSTAFISSLVGFFQEGIGKDGGFSDYILKSTFLISLFGIIPVLVVGFWFGWRIHRKGKN